MDSVVTCPEPTAFIHIIFLGWLLSLFSFIPVCDQTLHVTWAVPRYLGIHALIALIYGPTEYDIDASREHWQKG